MQIGSRDFGIEIDTANRSVALLEPDGNKSMVNVDLE
jgi:hypothetical protein